MINSEARRLKGNVAVKARRLRHLNQLKRTTKSKF